MVTSVPPKKISPRPSYLKTALAISKDGDSSIYLLIPEVQDTNGEWEAWHFANWMPGAERMEDSARRLTTTTTS